MSGSMNYGTEKATEAEQQIGQTSNNLERMDPKTGAVL